MGFNVITNIMTLMMKSTSGRRFWSSFLVGLLIFFIFFTLRKINFEPINYLLFVDAQISNHLFVLPKPSDPGTRSVIFIDIDNQSMNQHGNKLGSRTPRTMLAELLRISRDAGASVIFLDTDLRDSLPGDRELRNELKRSNCSEVVPKNRTVC